MVLILLISGISYPETIETQLLKTGIGKFADDLFCNVEFLINHLHYIHGDIRLQNIGINSFVLVVCSKNCIKYFIFEVYWHEHYVLIDFDGVIDVGPSSYGETMYSDEYLTDLSKQAIIAEGINTLQSTFNYIDTLQALFALLDVVNHFVILPKDETKIIEETSSEKEEQQGFFSCELIKQEEESRIHFVFFCHYSICIHF